MEILHLVQGYYPAIGGTEHLVRKISEGLVQQYRDLVTVYTLNVYNCDGFVDPRSPLLPKGSQNMNGVKIFRFPVLNALGRILFVLQNHMYHRHVPLNDISRTVYNGPISPQMLLATIRSDYDIAMASSFPLMHMYYAYVAKRINRRPLVFHCGIHTEDDWSFNRPCSFKIMRRCDALIANTTHERNYLVSKGLDAKTIHVVGCGVDLHEFDGANGREFRAKIGLSNEPIVLFVGQMVAHKGVDILLEAMKEVWTQFSDARLVLAGAPTAFNFVLERRIERLDPESRSKVISVGRFSEEAKPAIFASCDVFALPSRYESFGIAYLEAWACKKPVIGTWSGAIPSVIRDGEDGLLVAYGRTSELSEAIIKLLGDRSLASTLGRNGWNKVRRNYTWNVVVEKFRTIYQSCLRR